MKELYLVTCSFINGSLSLFLALDAFIAARLRYRNDVTGTPAQRLAFWGHVVAADDSTMVDVLVDMDLSFNGVHRGWL